MFKRCNGRGDTLHRPHHGNQPPVMPKGRGGKRWLGLPILGTTMPRFRQHYQLFVHNVLHMSRMDGAVHALFYMRYKTWSMWCTHAMVFQSMPSTPRWPISKGTPCHHSALDNTLP